ncbi:MAG: hypothetical protein QE271_09250 [Bacteriovoracaceae bacterium]|nr:hypothetical protein [Bacteriovoracaceae bacterium]
MNIMIRSTLAWICMVALSILNGAFRELVMKPIYGIQDPLANQLSCLTGVFILSTFTFFIWKKLKIKNFFQSCMLGIYWFLATMLFETLVINRKLSWTEILETYNVFAGNFWPFVLLWIGLMPIIFFLSSKRGSEK